MWIVLTSEKVVKTMKKGETHVRIIHAIMLLILKIFGVKRMTMFIQLV